MLLLRLNSNKELSCDATTSIYSSENNFDTIRIIASPTIDDKSIEDYKVELYVYNILNRDWNTFNDCVLCDFTLENNKCVFETPVKSQYTHCPCLGLYCKITNKDGVVGKTNTVEMPVFYHKDNIIDTGNSIQVFEKYRENIAKNALDILQGSDFIYFKKECENWNAPRIYFFNKSYPETGKHEAWAFDSSPYMLLNNEGYYYYPKLIGYDNVIFFCDKIDPFGWNYKTNDLTIPSSSWYKSPLFVQSEIGYDGFWADYTTKKTKLLVQLNWTDQISDIYKNSSIDVKYLDVNNVKIIPEICDFGMITNGMFGENEAIKNPYKYIELPIDFSKLFITFHSGAYTKSYTAERYKTCYEYPVLYNEDLYDTSTNMGRLQYFNAYADKKLKEKLQSCNRELLRRIEVAESSLITTKIDLANLSNNLRTEFGFTGSKDIIVNYDGDTYKVGKAQTRYCKIGRLINCYIRFEFDFNRDNSNLQDLRYTTTPWTRGNSILPFSINYDASDVSFNIGYYHGFNVSILTSGILYFALNGVTDNYDLADYFYNAKGQVSFSYYI